MSAKRGLQSQTGVEQAVTEVSLCARLGESTERSPVEPKACWEDEASSPLRGRQVGFRATLFHEHPPVLEESRSGERPCSRAQG